MQNKTTPIAEHWIDWFQSYWSFPEYGWYFYHFDIRKRPTTLYSPHGEIVKEYHDHGTTIGRMIGDVEKHRGGEYMDRGHTYESDIELGERYRDEQTGIEGVAVAIAFFQYACERITLELVVEGKLEEYTFDAPRLVCVDSGKRAEAEKTGGPDRKGQNTRPQPPSRR